MLALASSVVIAFTVVPALASMLLLAHADEAPWLMRKWRVALPACRPGPRRAAASCLAWRGRWSWPWCCTCQSARRSCRPWTKAI
ncbi:hypothetical protein [Arthrobacter methylotrophus]|uniref:hypothetical protein n=1 Tax=Arthrobacter methylotrophus TaxID=121291 RepID=UPI0031EA2C0D